MKTEYKYMVFVEYKDMFGDMYWRCLNRKDKKVLLAKIVWNDRWKVWEFQPEAMRSFTTDCLADIIDFIKQLAKR